ncbi:MAG: RluA family pseudouridine synthase [Negativicutes bacterium]|nr:RluA family pseudouridine synthase [Negativicutes bacterium]
METFQLDLNASACSIRSFLAQKGISLTNWRKIKAEGTILVNGANAPVSQRLQPGDTVSFSLPVQVSSVLPETGFIKIVYEDDDLIIVDKPTNMLVHPTVKDAKHTLANYLAGYYLQKKISAGIHPIFRLDRNTSGLVLFAKKPHVQHQLSSGSVQKAYLALLTSIPPATEGIIKAPIARKPGSIIERMVDEANGKYARTDYKVLAIYDNSLCLVRFVLFTGRTHQIRVHSAYIGCPLVGDNLYGPSGSQSRHALHCWRLNFYHPLTGKPIKVTSPLPSDLLKIINMHKLR